MPLMTGKVGDMQRLDTGDLFGFAKAVHPLVFVLLYEYVRYRSLIEADHELV